MSKKIIIEGVTKDGKQFRPSDWAERMSGSLSTFKNQRIKYSPMLKPSVQNNNKCVILDEKLRLTNPGLYQSILNFAKENNLNICDDGQEE